MKYFHQLSDTEIQKLLVDKVSIGYIKNNYIQPDWCSYENALDGPFGCWKLMDLFGNRKNISEESCKNCDCFNKKK